MGKMLIFEHDNFNTRHDGMWATIEGDIVFGQDDIWNDKISSIKVLSGLFRVYVNNFEDENFVELAAGDYRTPDEWRTDPSDAKKHLPDNSISMIKMIY